MTRRRRPAWMIVAALSLPVAPALLWAQDGEGPVAEDRPVGDDRALNERSTDEGVGAGEPERDDPTAVETDASDVTETPPRRAKPSTTRPAVRVRQQPQAPARKGGAAATRATTSPTTRPTKELTAEEMLSQMLKPQQAPGSRPLSPLPEVASRGADKTSGAGAVAPAAPVVNVLREGTFLVDRVGRLGRSADGGQVEFVFESDGMALQDPPLVIIPNLKLMQIEDAAANSTRDLRFRISGMVTEYRGRNHVLLEKAVVVPEVLDRF